MPTSTGKPTVCICTPDIIGPVRNGGIGTAYHSLARFLVEEGYDVTVLYATSEEAVCEDETLDHWERWYGSLGIAFEVVPTRGAGWLDMYPAARASHFVYQYFKKAGDKFDIVHFPEWGGVGYYSIVAKTLGLGLQNTSLVVGTHSPTLWGLEGNRLPVSHPEQLERDYFERLSAQYADWLVSPSRYMFEWMKDRGWKLAERRRVIQNISDQPVAPNQRVDQSINELVFFGRLEKRKGLDLFIEAIKRAGLDQEPNLTLTFLGKECDLEGETATEHIAAATASWQAKVRIETRMDRDTAVAYLSQPHRLAVMPSIMENSPYTVLECLSRNIPFIASRVGGIPELICPEDQDRTTFPLHPGKLGERLKSVFESGFAPARPSVTPLETKAEWRKLHTELIASRKERTCLESALEVPKVSVVLVHHDRPALVFGAINSLKAQDYTNFEVILVDAGSKKAESLQFVKSLEPEFLGLGWKIAYDADRYLGAARNYGASFATGEYLVFMDDDNIATPQELSTFVNCAEFSNADLLTCAFWLFSSTDEVQARVETRIMHCPSGASIALGLFENRFGDANFIIRKSVFDRLGGFTEDYGLGFEDYELLSKAALEGCSMFVVPEPLFYYRYSADSMSSLMDLKGAHLRALRTYIERVGPEMGSALTVLANFNAVRGDQGTRQRLEESYQIALNLLNTPQHKLVEKAASMMRPATRLVRRLVRRLKP